jgi:1-acyl-sn-glycerol-3-phosphate acyltransferase
MDLYSSHYPFSPLVRTLLIAFVRLYFHLKIVGREHLPTHGPFILVANHSSHADTAILFSTLPASLRSRVLAGAARDYFFDQGVWQAIARTLFNAIPVARDAVPGEDPLRHAIRALREGYGLVLYPEGTRSLDGAIGPFRRGIGRLIATFPGMPVIPVRLMGTTRAMPKGSVIPRPYQIQVRFGEPLYLHAQPENRESWQAAADAVRMAVIELEKGEI